MGNLSNLHTKLTELGYSVSFGDKLSDYPSPDILLTIFTSIDSDDGLWLMSDLGLTPVIWRAGHTNRLATVDLNDPEGAVKLVKKFLHNEV